MSFIAVVNIWFYAQCHQGPDAAYPKDQLLLEPILVVASVQIVRDSPVLRGVIFHVSIQQIEFYLTHTCKPHSHLHRSSRPYEGNCQMIVLAVLYRTDRQP